MLIKKKKSQEITDKINIAGMKSFRARAFYLLEF